MRNHIRPRPHTSAATSSARRSVPKTRAATWQLTPQLLSDAVVAGYIHDISARHRRPRTDRPVTTAYGAERFR